MELISVIIPCFNSGKYLEEAIESIQKVSYCNIEIVISDDGSDDAYTAAILDGYKRANTNIRVIHQANLGPAAARNTGVRHSKGEYLLFLDSDNKIKAEYPTIAIDVLRTRPEYGVVYAKPIFFGDTATEERFVVEHFNLDRLLIGNYVDMCSIVRRQAWEDAGGFDELPVLQGREDWEFWIRIARKGWKFYMLDQQLFYYRVRNNSVTTEVVGDMQKRLVEYVSEKHHDIIFARYKFYFRLYKSIQRKPIRFFLKFLYSKLILGKDYIPGKLGKQSIT